VDTITVTLIYVNHPGRGYFDNVTLLHDSDGFSKYEYGDNGYVSSYRQGKEQVWNTYDDKDRLSWSISSEHHAENYLYDSKDRLQLVTYYYYAGFYSPYTTNIFDIVQTQLIEAYTYDSYGLVTEVKTSKGNAMYKTRAEYDTSYLSNIFGALISESDEMGNTTRYFYDETNGRLMAVGYPKHNGVVYSYDGMGNLTSVLPAVTTEDSIVGSDGLLYPEYHYFHDTDEGERVNYTYDSITKRLTTITTESTTYRFTYDSFGNTTSVGAGSNTLASYTYNSNNGKLNTLTYGNGFSEKYIYDTLDRISEIQYNTGSGGAYETVYEYAYNTEGQLHSVTDKTSGEVTVYEYDSAGRLQRSVVYDGDSYRNLYSSSIIYDEDSRIEYLFNYFDYVVGNNKAYEQLRYFYRYNDEGRIDKVLFNSSNVSTGTGSLEITLDPNYDNLGRVTDKSVSVKINGVNKFYSKQTYSYFNYNTANTTPFVSQVTSTVKTSETGSTISSTTYKYTYDKNGNITEIRNANNEIQNKYYYDDLGQLIREDNKAGNYTLLIKYDEAGNILGKSYIDFTTSSTSQTPTTTYTYGNSQWGDLLTSINGLPISYDGIGNPTLIGYEGFHITARRSHGRADSS
jgi:YD repeat-containing protein